MHLAQHHFQAQNRYFEESIRAAVDHLFFRPYGCSAVALDEEALLNGTASVVHARGIMPDGTPFHFPEQDPTPAPLEIAGAFGPTDQRKLLCLVIPGLRAGAPNCAPVGAAPDDSLRYRATTVHAMDETSGSDERAITTAEKNFRLALEPEDTPGLVSMPVSRIRRDSTGGFIVDGDYVPPCLRIGASKDLLESLHQLIEKLEFKAESLTSDRADPSAGIAQYGSREIGSFWLAHAIHQSLGPLRHHLSSRGAHPELLYTELARLAGALCTFSLASNPREVPPYDHDDLGTTFAKLDEHIRQHLDIVLPQGAISVPLQPYVTSGGEVKEFLHVAEVRDPRCFGPSDWILGVSSKRSASVVRDEVERNVKVGEAKRVIAITRTAGVPGLGLTYLPSPPAEINPRVGSAYFRIAREGPLWTALQDSPKRQFGAFVPTELQQDTEFELLVLLDS